ncbi:MAG: Gfo/Idh/MocA family oxidoreductase [Chloroflexi bacterium]|nr:Gfo/Idh/MocA family oxidoreductase [Chloroflexota bacterium]
MAPQPPVRFSAIGLNHPHIYGQTDLLLRAGAELVSFHAVEPELAGQYTAAFPQASLARCVDEILEDDTIDLVVSAAIPSDRARVGIAAMTHGKDFMSDKPGFTTMADLFEARRVRAEAQRIYSICFSERLESRATVKAQELVSAGAIGQAVHTIGIGPHRINASRRPPWFFDRERYGGILIDIASHQIDQYVVFTGSSDIEIAASTVANYKYPEYPDLEDFGEALLRSERATGYIRVDWYTPDGLETWGDTRLMILGTDGTIELRKNCDLCGRPGGDHLFLVDLKGTHYVDCSDVDLPYGRQLLADIRNRTETSMRQSHPFLVSELALKGQAQAKRMGHLNNGQ